MVSQKCGFLSGHPVFTETVGYPTSLYMYSVSQKKSPLRGHDIFHFFHKRLRIFNRFFTHLLYVLIHARLQIFIQLSPTLTKLFHTKRDHLANFYISLEL